MTKKPETFVFFPWVFEHPNAAIMESARLLEQEVADTAEREGVLGVPERVRYAPLSNVDGQLTFTLGFLNERGGIVRSMPLVVRGENVEIAIETNSPLDARTVIKDYLNYVASLVGY